MKVTIKTLLILSISFAFSLSVFSQSSKFEKRTFIYKGDTLLYNISYPDNYNSNQKYPLFLFLHGSGERGNNNTSQLTHGSAMFLNPANRAKYPAIVIFPQCPSNNTWTTYLRNGKGISFAKNDPITEPMMLVVRLLKDVQKKESVDTKRLYVSGLSMGGMGTFDLICRYPKMFAAAVPICGGVDLERLKKVKKLPIRIYHGAKDDLVTPEFSRSAYAELKAEGSQVVEYYEFPDANHNSWDPAFNQHDFLEWIFKQKK